MRPIAKKCLELADLFEKVDREFPRGKLDMDETCVRDKRHPCGTAHCHAGWAAVMLLDDDDLDLIETSKLNPSYIGYDVGKEAMALFLEGGSIDVKNMDRGSHAGQRLRDWAVENPYLWGNDLGRQMFCSRTTFFHLDKRPHGALTLQHIADHWREVGERIALLEKKETEPTATDAT